MGVAVMFITNDHFLKNYQIQTYSCDKLLNFTISQDSKTKKKRNDYLFRIHFFKLTSEDLSNRILW